MNYAAFNTLHDGYISDILGSVPGQITLVVQCQYLRERIVEPGENFVLKIKNCSKFVYFPYEDQGYASEVTNLSEIKLVEPGFVSADQANGFIEIHCDDGKIEMIFESLTIWLNKGKEITQAELETVAESYWKEWKEEWKKNSEIN